MTGWAALCGAAGDTASEPARGIAPLLSLILPLESPDFAAPASAVAAGCRSALQVDGNPLSVELSRTDAAPANVIAAYRAAIERGAAVIVGPMTRDSVTALAHQVKPSAPTLALNIPEGDAVLPPGFFSFGLSAEAEARLIARSAAEAGLRSAVVVQARSALARRMSQAFADEWFALGGSIPDVQDFSREANLSTLRQRLAASKAELIFLSGDAADARLVAPYLARHIPIYAVSLVHTGRPDPLASADLEGIRLFEMPWLVQPDHPAVMVYPRPESLADELQRFYALGIDACRLAPLLAAHREALELDGVTGRIRMRAGGRIEREPVASVFRDGSAVPDRP